MARGGIKKAAAIGGVAAGLLIPDTHAPYHDERAWGVCMGVGADLRPKYARILGDFGDWYSVSRHPKDPERPFKIDGEVEVVNRCLNDVDSIGASDKEYLFGNHEKRLADYIATTQLHGLRGTTVQELLELKRRGWKWVPYRHDSKIGGLTLTHDAGHEGKYAVQHTLEVYHRDIAFGHVHTLASKYANDADGRAFFSMSLGWLGALKWVDYRPMVSAKKCYTHGFGILWLDEYTGRGHIQQVPILDGVAIVNGKRYS